MTTVRLIVTLLILTLAAPALAVVLTPAQPVHEVGDLLTFSVLNDGAVTIHFPTVAPLKLHNLDTDEVFTFVGVPDIADLDSGNTTMFEISSTPVTPGSYDVILEYYVDALNEFTTSTTIVLNIKVDAPPESMGELKSRFKD
jgi:hypothetical protein